jgi:hypothetical protein
MDAGRSPGFSAQKSFDHRSWLLKTGVQRVESSLAGQQFRPDQLQHSTNPESLMSLRTVEIEPVDWIKGVAVPRGARFRQIIVTGPPGSGKSSLVQKLGGWPEEGCIDLAMNHWWRSRVLALRPREVHFKIPFTGFRDSHTVFDREWLDAPAPVDYRRIQIPPDRSWFFLQINWRSRFIFDFQLPSMDRICQLRKTRAAAKSHPVDMVLVKAEVERQYAVYESLALHFHRCGMRVVVRTDYGGMPRTVIDTDDSAVGDAS